MFLPHNQSKVKLYAALFTVLLQSTVLFSQIDNAFSCFAVGKNALLEDVFYEYNSASNTWAEISKSTNSNITALTSNPVTKTLYAVNGQSFGTFIPTSGSFNAISHINKTLSGELGGINIKSVGAMTYDAVNQEIYAVYRLTDYPDIIFKINPETGEIIRNGFKHSKTKVKVDYQVVEELELDGNIYDIASDITLDPLSGQLYVMYQHRNDFCLVVSDKAAGSIIAPLFEIKDKFVNNLTFSSKGKLFAVAKDMTSNESNVYQIDQFMGSVQAVSKVTDDAGLQFTAVEFLKPYHDLALKIEVSPNQSLPAVAGQELTFDIEIINQGEIDVNYVQIVNYLSSGLTLKEQAGWLSFNDNFTLLDIHEGISPNESIIKQIQFITNDLFTGSIANFAEINLYVNTYTEDGLPLVWPDIDSYADNKNDEIIYIDNEVNENGVLHNGDEDDHDVVTISLNSNCISQMSFSNTNIVPSLYQVGDHIYSDDSVVGNGTTFKAGREIIMNQGFEVTADANFEAGISTCE